MNVYIIANTKEKPSMTNWYFSKSCKATKVKRVSKIWIRMATNDILLLQFRIQNHWCQYIRTHTKEKPSKISNTTFASLPSYQKKMFKLNGYPEYFGIYYSWWNHQMCSKMIHFNIKMQNLELVNLKVCNVRPTHSSVLENVWKSIFCIFHRELFTCKTVSLIVFILSGCNLDSILENQ